MPTKSLAGRPGTIEEREMSINRLRPKEDEPIGYRW
jgi:hypothetical protein